MGDEAPWGVSMARRQQPLPCTGHSGRPTAALNTTTRPRPAAGQAERAFKEDEGVPFLSNTSLLERPTFDPQGSCEEVMGRGRGN